MVGYLEFYFAEYRTRWPLGIFTTFASCLCTSLLWTQSPGSFPRSSLATDRPLDFFCVLHAWDVFRTFCCAANVFSAWCLWSFRFSFEQSMLLSFYWFALFGWEMLGAPSFFLVDSAFCQGCLGTPFGFGTKANTFERIVGQCFSDVHSSLTLVHAKYIPF